MQTVSTLFCQAHVEDSSGIIFVNVRRMQWKYLGNIRVHHHAEMIQSARMQFQWKFSIVQQDLEISPWIDKVRFEVYYQNTLDGVLNERTPLPIGSQIAILINGVYDTQSVEIQDINNALRNHLHRRSPTLPIPLQPSLVDRVAFLEQNLDPSYPDVQRYRQLETNVTSPNRITITQPLYKREEEEDNHHITENESYVRFDNNEICHDSSHLNDPNNAQNHEWACQEINSSLVKHSIPDR